MVDRLNFIFLHVIVPNNPKETVLKSNNKNKELNFKAILNICNLIRGKYVTFAVNIPK